MAIRTRLTEFFGLQHPIVLAPMTPAAGADLASAVSDVGCKHAFRQPRWPFDIEAVQEAQGR
jgi:hypothetical protein